MATARTGTAPGSPAPRLGLPAAGAGYRLVSLALLLLAGVGLYLLVFQQWRLGLGVTGMNTPTYWGLYIVNFAFFIGLSAGGILVSALAHIGGVKRFAPVARMAEVLAIISLILAQIFIVVDLGRPERLLNLFVYGWTQRWQSPLIWDVTIILVYLVLALALFYYGTRADLARLQERGAGPRLLYRLLTLGRSDTSEAAVARDRHVLHLLAFVSVPGAVALHSVTAWIFGLMVARPGWHTALLAPLFVTSAIVSGLALVTVVAALARRFLGAPVGEDTIRSLGRLLMWLIPVLGYLMFSELLTVKYAGSVTHNDVFRDMMSGRFAGFFWYNFFFGLLGPFLILALNRGRSTAAVALAALMVVIGVWIERYLLIVPAQVNIPLYPQGVYRPTAAEWGIMAGTYALGALLYLWLARRVPLVPAEE